MKQPKVLFTAKVDSHIRHFHLPFIKLFHDHGYQVDVASQGTEAFANCDTKFNVAFGTNPFSKEVISSYKQLKKIITEEEYEIVHTHTAIASVLTRLVVWNVNRKRSFKSRVIYTAHGFHFLKGGSKSSWLLYYPVERCLARITDDLILINQEDFNLATKHKMAKRRYLVPGVGIDLDYFSPSLTKKETSPYVITYVAELSVNKNQMLLLQAALLLKQAHRDFIVQIVGSGDNEVALQAFIQEHSLENHVKMLGYRKDVKDILDATHLVAATSLREGLPINIIESMAMGIPLIVTHCRGHIDLVEDGVNGFVISYQATELFEKIIFLMDHPEQAETISLNNIKKAQNYGVDMIVKEMAHIYKLD